MQCGDHYSQYPQNQKEHEHASFFHPHFFLIFANFPVVPLDAAKKLESYWILAL